VLAGATMGMTGQTPPAHTHVRRAPAVRRAMQTTLFSKTFLVCLKRYQTESVGVRGMHAQWVCVCGWMDGFACVC
jgi:hypothetical protein